MKKKSTLFISYDGMTDPLGQSQVLPYLVGLSKLGHQITILSVEKKENFLKRKDLINQITTEANIDWHYIFYTKKPPIFSTIYDLWQMKKKIKSLHKIKKFDILHCRSYIAALIGLEFQFKWQVKFIFDMRGFWADERVDGGLWNIKNPLFKQVYLFFKRKEKQFLQKADYVISLTQAAKKEIQTWQLKQLAPIQVIPCCVDTDLFNYQKYNIEKNNTWTISYLGSLGTWYLLKEMLSFFKKLIEKYPNSKFLFITPDKPEMILKEAENFNIPSKHFDIRFAEKKEVPLLLQKTHLSLFFIKPAYSKIASSPTKMGEVLAMGLPIIANKGVGDNDYLFQNYECGILVDDFQDETFERVITEIEKLFQNNPNSYREVALDYFSLEKGIEKYNEVYQKI